MDSAEGRGLRALASQSPSPNAGEAPSSSAATTKHRADFHHLVDQVAKENPHLRQSEVWSRAHAQAPDLYAKAKGAS
jgi:hypothetical protein